MKFSTQPFGEKVTTPWGEEVIFTPNNLHRTGKLLTIKAGKRLSFQYHDQKEETMCLLSGKVLLWIENQAGEIEKIPMELQKGYTVEPMQKHRLEAIEDSLLVEASSPEIGTTYRLDDDYNRHNETPEVRHEPNRGWQAKQG